MALIYCVILQFSRVSTGSLRDAVHCFNALHQSLLSWLASDIGSTGNGCFASRTKQTASRPFYCIQLPIERVQRQRKASARNFNPAGLVSSRMERRPWLYAQSGKKVVAKTEFPNADIGASPDGPPDLYLVPTPAASASGSPRRALRFGFEGVVMRYNWAAPFYISNLAFVAMCRVSGINVGRLAAVSSRPLTAPGRRPAGR